MEKPKKIVVWLAVFGLLFAIQSTAPGQAPSETQPLPESTPTPGSQDAAIESEPALANDASEVDQATDSAENDAAADDELDEDAEEPPTPEVEQPLSEEEVAKLRELFDTLGSNQFQKREEATTKLIHQGQRVLDLLKQWQTETTSPETHARAQLIIHHIEQSGLPKRIAIFMRTPADVEHHGFYGWQRFSEVAGTNRIARRIFTEMLDRHAKLCNEAISDEQLLTIETETVQALSKEILAYKETTVADAVVAQYLMILLKEKTSEDLERITSRLVKFAPYSRELNSDQGTMTVKRITGQWINSVQRDFVSALLVSLSYSIPDGIELARKVLAAGPPDENTFDLAMQAIVVFGDAQDLPLVEKFLNDERVVFVDAEFVNGVIAENKQQYRDLALATAVHLRKLEMADYFPTAEKHHLRGYNSRTIRFAGADADLLRQAAFERYKAAVTANAAKQ